MSNDPRLLEIYSSPPLCSCTSSSTSLQRQNSRQSEMPSSPTRPCCTTPSRRPVVFVFSHYVAISLGESSNQTRTRQYHQQLTPDLKYKLAQGGIGPKPIVAATRHGDVTQLIVHKYRLEDASNAFETCLTPSKRSIKVQIVDVP